MRKFSVPEIDNPILIRTKRLMSELEAGRETAVRIGTEAEARVQIGRCVYWNRQKVMDYVNSLSQ